MASKYRLYRSFVKLIYRAGNQQQTLYKHLEEGCFPVEFALQVVFECDHEMISKFDEIKTYDVKYDGCQIFDIFEQSYRDDLGRYLSIKN